jgi:hypothetical protein
MEENDGGKGTRVMKHSDETDQSRRIQTKEVYSREGNGKRLAPMDVCVTVTIVECRLVGSSDD